MNKTILALVVLPVIFVLGCQPAAQPPAAPAAPAPEGVPAAPAPEDAPRVAVMPGSEAQPAPAPADELPPAPLENIPVPVGEAEIEDVCFSLLSADEYKATCGYDGLIELTHKISEEDCWTAILDPMNRKLNAGFTVVEWKNAQEANKEFDRGVSMRRTQGAVEGKDVGERSYQYAEIGRHNIVWVRGRLLTRLASAVPTPDQKGCPPDKLLQVAKMIDARMP